MKQIKEKKNKRGLVVDILIVLIVFGLIGTGLFLTLKPAQVSTVTLEYTVVFETVEKGAASAITPHRVFLSENGEHMGTIISALNDRKVYVAIDKSNAFEAKYVNSVSSEFNTVRATVQTEAVFNNGSYYAGGVPIRAGEQIVLRLPNFYGRATVVSVSVKEAG